MVGFEMTYFGIRIGRIYNLREGDHLGSLRYLLVLNLEEVGSADHLIDRSETEFCHDLS